MPLSQPINYHKEDQHLFPSILASPLPPLEILKIDNGSLFDDGSVFQKNKLIKRSLRLEEMSYIYTFSRYWRRKLFYKKAKRSFKYPLISILDHWSHEYYHWFADALPRLLLARELFPNMSLVLSTQYRKEYISQTLNALDIDDVLYLARKHYISFDEIFLPSYTNTLFFPHYKYCKAIRRLMWNYFNLPQSVKPFRCIYVSRARARHRHVLNEDDVWQVLKKRSFEFIVAEELSFQEQVKLFSETKCLVSIHGAGLTNLHFMPEHTKLLELRKNIYGVDPKTGKRELPKFNNCYYHLCQALNIGYYYQKCFCPDSDKLTHEADIVVDLDTLEENLENLLGEL